MWSYITSFFQKELHHITAPFDKMVTALENFVSKAEQKAQNKYVKSAQLVSQAQDHLIDAGRAKNIMDKIKSIL